MISFTFNSLFKTVNKGIPNQNQMQYNGTLSYNYFISSAILQAIIFLIFLLYFIMSIYRVVNRIKNKRFKTFESVKQNKNVGRQIKQENRQLKMEDKKNEDDYQYDKLLEQYYGIDRQQQKKIQQQRQVLQAQFNNFHHENQEYFIKIDRKLIFFHPFLISFIIVNNTFAVDYVTISLIIGTCISYLLFNILKKLKKINIFRIFFILLSFLGYFSFFYNNKNYI